MGFFASAPKQRACTHLQITCLVQKAAQKPGHGGASQKRTILVQSIQPTSQVAKVALSDCENS